jgi:diguanylate cyclase (GGDEF)-like protein
MRLTFWEREVSKYRCSLLVVDDEPYICSTLAGLLSPEFEVLTADAVEAAQNTFASRTIDIILTDQKMPRSSGIQLLEWVRQHSPKTVRMMMTGFAELEEAVDAINKGQVFRYLFKPWRHEELLEILRSAARTFQLERSNELLMEELRDLNDQLRVMNAGLEKRVADRTRALEEAYLELEQKNKMLEKLALTDPLTNLPNRRAMDRLAERELRRRDRYPGPLSIGLIDVDHFKSINDRYLLPGGDKVLVDLARALTGSLRTVDFLGRIGGEEFMVIAPETDMAGAMVLGERIRSTIEKTEFSYKDDVIAVRVSLGFAVADTSVTADFDNMKHLAAAALSEAKKTGRNRCVYFTLPHLGMEQAG